MIDVIYLFIFVTFAFFLVIVSNCTGQQKKLIEKYKLCELAEIKLITALKQMRFEDKQIFYNLYIPNRDNYTQIDVLVVCKIGIIVFEVKDYTGWIFGGIDEKYWYHTYANQEKYKMINPIRQNLNHISCLRQQIKGINMFNVVVFFGDCWLKNTKFLSSKSCLIYATDLDKCIQYLYHHNKHCYDKIKNNHLMQLQEFMNNAHNTEIVEKHKAYIRNIKTQNHEQ